MIALKVNDAFLDLLPNTSIPITMLCPLFDSDSIERTFSYPFVIPATATNLSALQYVNRIDTNTSLKLSCELYLENLLFEQGVMLIKGADSKKIKCVFQNNPLDITNRLGRIKLRDLGGAVTVASKYCPDVFVSAVIPVPTEGVQRMAIGINEHVFDSIMTELDDLLDQINSVYPGFASEPVLGQGPFENLIHFTCADPSLYTIYLNPPVSDPDIYIFFSLFDSTSDTEAQRIHDAYDSLLSSTAEIDEAAFPIVYAPNIYDKKNEQYFGYLNYTYPNGAHPNDPTALLDETGFPYTITPFPFLSEALDLIAGAVSELGSFAGEFLDDSEISTLILWNNNPIDNVVNDADTISELEPQNIRHSYQGEWNISDHLPDVSALEFLNRLLSTFCLFQRYEGKKLYLKPKKNLLDDLPEDWTNLSEPGHPLLFNQVDGYSLDYDRQGDDTNVPGQLQRIDGGEEALEFRAGLYSLHEKSESIVWQVSPEDLRTWLLPFTSEKGRSDYYDLSNAPTLRLLFWRGLQPDAEGDNYALATHGAEDYAGNSVGNYSLDWSGEKGLYEVWWKDYIKLLTTGRTVTIPIRLSIHQVIELRKWKHITKLVNFPEGQFVGVVKSVKFTATMRGISVAQVEFLQKK